MKLYFLPLSELFRFNYLSFFFEAKCVPFFNNPSGCVPSAPTVSPH